MVSCCASRTCQANRQIISGCTRTIAGSGAHSSQSATVVTFAVEKWPSTARAFIGSVCMIIRGTFALRSASCSSVWKHCSGWPRITDRNLVGRTDGVIEEVRVYQGMCQRVAGVDMLRDVAQKSAKEQMFARPRV